MAPKTENPSDLDCWEEKSEPVSGLDVTNILVMLVPGPDQVNLTTTLPGGFPPDVDPGPLTLRFDTRKGHGLEYVQEHLAHKFPTAAIEVLDTSTGKRTVVEKRLCVDTPGT